MNFAVSEPLPAGAGRRVSEKSSPLTAWEPVGSAGPHGRAPLAVLALPGLRRLPGSAGCVPPAGAFPRGLHPVQGPQRPPAPQAGGECRPPGPWTFREGGFHPSHVEGLLSVLPKASRTIVKTEVRAVRPHLLARAEHRNACGGLGCGLHGDPLLPGRAPPPAAAQPRFPWCSTGVWCQDARLTQKHGAVSLTFRR